MEQKRIICTVTNDLNFDQRMIRICTSLADAGYHVTLVGRKRKTSQELQPQKFNQVRLNCWFDKGKLFYVEFQIRLLVYLLRCSCDLICSIDLDSILPGYFASRWRNKIRVYDAHELFCEMDEIVSRPRVYRIWKRIERYVVPKYPLGYTIGDCYADEFRAMYGVQYEVVRNATRLYPESGSEPRGEYILYQGAVNEGRCFETLIPAMTQVNFPLLIIGKGNFFEQAQSLVKEYQLEHRIKFQGFVDPKELKLYTQGAKIGLTLFSQVGKSNYLSMANRFFDYMHAGIPQLCMDYPEYRKCLEKYPLAVLLQQTDSDSIAAALNAMLLQTDSWQWMHEQALLARKEYCWEEEEKKLLAFYKNIFES